MPPPPGVAGAAAEPISRRRPQVAYFPSYAIVTGALARGGYFAADLRSVTQAGVDHVMRLFMPPYGGLAPAPVADASQDAG